MRLKSNYLWGKNNNCVVIIALMLKGRRYSVLKSYFNYAFIGPKKDKTQSKYLNEALILLNPNPTWKARPNLQTTLILAHEPGNLRGSLIMIAVCDDLSGRTEFRNFSESNFQNECFSFFFLPLGALAQVRIFIKPHQRKTSLLVLNARFSSRCWNTSTVGFLNSMKN